jgi:hypothetical protein
VSGVVGLDPQPTRTCIALVEGGGDSRATGAAGGPIGDGRRLLVPNACGPDGSWGSQAAEESLRRLDVTGVGLADHLVDWCIDPLDTPFLRGVHDRLFGYLGRTSPTNAHGYHVCLAVPTGVDWTALSRRAASAGLTSTSPLRPAEALVYRWLTEPGTSPPPDGVVVAVACGEAATSAAAFHVDGLQSPKRVAILASGDRPVGSWPVSAAVARRVLERCREGVPAASLLGLLDGGFEFAAMLRSQPRNRDVTWDGPLTDRMFAPLRLSGEAIAAWPEAAALAAAIAELANSVVIDEDVEPLVLVGGLGAVWPFVADALRDIGPVWQSPDPAVDVAIGAAWSQWLLADLVATDEDMARLEAGVLEPPHEVEPAHPAPDAPADVPPWLREH